MKENVIQASVHKVSDGAKFRVDFKTRSMWINGKKIIDKGEIHGEHEKHLDNVDEALQELDNLFELYHRSIPSERSNNKRKVYFHAVKEKDLTFMEMITNLRRDEAQILLELTLLLDIIDGTLTLDDLFANNRYFYQSQKNRDFVIYKDWF